MNYPFNDNISFLFFRLLNCGRMFVWSKEQARELLAQRYSSERETNLREEHNLEDSCKPSQDGQLETKLNIPFYDETSSQDDSEAEIFIDASTDFPNSRCILSIHPTTNPCSNRPSESQALSHSSTCTREVEVEWWADKIVLDLGAGDGHVTQILSESAKKVYVTETSGIMRKRLSSKGYT